MLRASPGRDGTRTALTEDDRWLAIAADYGPEWADGLLHGWFGGGIKPAWNQGEGQSAWVAASLPGICADLHAAGHGKAARRLLELSWDRVRQDASTGL